MWQKVAVVRERLVIMKLLAPSLEQEQLFYALLHFTVAILHFTVAILHFTVAILHCAITILQSPIALYNYNALPSYLNVHLTPSAFSNPMF